MLRKMMVLAIGSVAALTALLLLSANQSVEAAPTNEVEITWIDEDGNPVGSYLKLCTGQSDIDGTVSDYKIVHTEHCQTSATGGGCWFQTVLNDCELPPWFLMCEQLYGELWCRGEL